MDAPSSAQSLKQFTSFAFLGLFAAGIDFSLYVILIKAGLDPIYGNVLSSSGRQCRDCKGSQSPSLEFSHFTLADALRYAQSHDGQNERKK